MRSANVVRSRGIFRVVGVCAALMLVTAACAGEESGDQQESEVAAAATNETADGDEASDSGEEHSPVTLRAVMFAPEQSSSNDKFLDWVETINQDEEHAIEVELRGGPEAIPSSDQFDAVQSGVVDLVHAATTHHPEAVPEGMAAALTSQNIVEQRESGFTGALGDVYSEQGAHLLGRVRHSEGVYLYLNEEVSRPDDLAGMTFRTGALHRPFLESLGVEPVDMPLPDIHGAMERGVIDGYPHSETYPADTGLYEVTGHRINHPFYYVDLVVLLNQDTWEGLSDGQRQFLEESIQEVEREAIDYYERLGEEAEQILIDNGVEMIEFEEDVAEAYVQQAYDVAWEDLIERSPEAGQRLRELSESGD